jgi:hypothetical protein
MFANKWRGCKIRVVGSEARDILEILDVLEEMFSNVLECSGRSFWARIAFRSHAFRTRSLLTTQVDSDHTWPYSPCEGMNWGPRQRSRAAPRCWIKSLSVSLTLHEPDDFFNYWCKAPVCRYRSNLVDKFPSGKSSSGKRFQVAKVPMGKDSKWQRFQWEKIPSGCRFQSLQVEVPWCLRNT